MSEAKASATLSYRCEPRGMITVRADLDDAAIASAVSTAIGAGVPGMRQIVATPAGLAVWMSPDELLVTCDYTEADAVASGLRTVLADVHHLVVNVSDARALFAIEGDHWRDVLAKGMPVDFRPTSFGDGQVRRSRLGQVAAAIWMTDESRAELVCFRSVADFVEDWLALACKDGHVPEFY